MEVSIYSSFSSAIPIFARGSGGGMGLKRKSAAPERSKPAKTEDQNYYCRLTVELCMHCYTCKRLIGICPNRIKLCPSVAQTGLAEEEQEEGMQTSGWKRKWRQSGGENVKGQIKTKMHRLNPVWLGIHESVKGVWLFQFKVYVDLEVHWFWDL